MRLPLTTTVRDWTLIFSIFHTVYYVLAVIADIFFFALLNNMKKEHNYLNFRVCHIHTRLNMGKSKIFGM